MTLLRTADLARRALGAVVEEHAITPQQYNVLRILRGAGASGLPTLEIADRMIEESPGITRLLDRLEAKGLVRRERCPHDRRQVLLHDRRAGPPAPRGPRRAGRAGAAGRFLAPLDAAGTRELIRLLDAIRAAPRLARRRTRRRQENRRRRRREDDDDEDDASPSSPRPWPLASPALAADTYQFDKAHTTVRLPGPPHRDERERQVHRTSTGTIQIDRAKPESSSVEFTIKAASIDTNEPKRDEHLRSADFFDVANQPDDHLQEHVGEGDGQGRLRGDRQPDHARRHEAGHAAGDAPRRGQGPLGQREDRASRPRPPSTARTTASTGTRPSTRAACSSATTSRSRSRSRPTRGRSRPLK